MTRHVLTMVAMMLVVASCGGDDDEAEAQKQSGSNGAPTISGKPPTQVAQSNEYTFAPTASDPDGDVLTFSIVNKPPWATFDIATGRLQGIPASADVGTYASIQIKVTDGELSSTLASFSIAVVAGGSGAATLSWTAPTQKSDGTPLVDLAGFRVYWGTSQDKYTNSATIDNPGITTYVVEQLTPATWYFVATAFDSKGNESQFSNVASKTVL